MARRSKTGASNLHLHAAASHGITAKTHHGPGGMRAAGMKVPKVHTPKAGVTIKHTKGVKIPNSMHTPRPGKGTGNHMPHLKAYHAQIGHLARNPARHSKVI